ncbi:MAG: 50S ribosomal protein L9 [Gammaproteobacteria bacterium]|nr:50S ribosomal protein L9 [Pseudomonadota bacterium]MCH9662454.1 50S ribosomal protein L9 [Gammaproteobacteria bacterium]
MRVILLEKIINFGSFGDIVKVRPGYARNYLLPRGKALLASGANLKYFEERKLHLQEISQEEEQRALARAEKFSTAKLPIRAQADADGRLFGSVGVREILVASDLAGLEITQHEIIMPADSRIRTVGEHQVRLRLHHGVEAAICVEVIAADQ